MKELTVDHYPWQPMLLFCRKKSEEELEEYLIDFEEEYPAGFDLGHVTGFKLYHRMKGMTSLVHMYRFNSL